jgi:hypothetical protein
MEEAKVQLGVWVAAQVARVEALIQQAAMLKANKHGAEREVRRGRGKGRGKGGKIPAFTIAEAAVNPNSRHLYCQPGSLKPSLANRVSPRRRPIQIVVALLRAGLYLSSREVKFGRPKTRLTHPNLLFCSLGQHGEPRRKRIRW